MRYLNENGLVWYDGLIKNWVTFKSGTVDGIDPLLNWQKTSTAGAVTCYPLPAAPIDPVVNFLFTETGPAEGAKGPDNPSTITGVESVKVTRCGKNLIWEPWKDTATVTRNGITWTVNDDGTVTASGTATSDSYFNIRDSAQGRKQQIKGGLSYVLSGSPSGGSNSTYLLSLVCRSTTFKDYGSSVTVNVNADDYGWMVCCVRSGITVFNLAFRPQLELGTTATAFEPYDGTDYTVNLGGTYYGGSVDLSTGTMTVTHVLVEPDSLSYDISAHPANAGSFQYTDTFGRTVTTDGNTLTITGETGGQIVYNLATPEAVSLTPTQIYSLSQIDPYTPRLNTVYSDQNSVQVGYPKSPLATSAELTNAIISLGGNI